LGFPIAGGVSTSGSNLFGADYFYQHTLQDVCPVAGGSWGSGSYAGVWLLALNHVRGLSTSSVGFRAALYL